MTPRFVFGPAKHRSDERERREIVPQRGAKVEVDGGDGCG